MSGFTSAPGRRRIRSTRPCVVAGIQRMSSGTSVPEPRTCRTIGPRFTVSIHTVARSTPGAAGFSRDTPTLMSTMIDEQRDANVDGAPDLLLPFSPTMDVQCRP